MGHFEDIPEYRDQMMPVSYRLLENEILEMGKRFDPMPFHVDAIEAEQSIFGGLIASSCHLYAIYIWLMDRNMRPPIALAGLGMDQLRFLQPGRPGDELHLSLTTEEKRVSKSRPDCGIVRYKFALLKSEEPQSDLFTVVMSGIESVLYRRSSYEVENIEVGAEK
jgi:acyl dehydratase